MRLNGGKIVLLGNRKTEKHKIYVLDPYSRKFKTLSVNDVGSKFDSGMMQEDPKNPNAFFYFDRELSGPENLMILRIRMLWFIKTLTFIENETHARWEYTTKPPYGRRSAAGTAISQRGLAVFGGNDGQFLRNDLWLYIY